MSHPLSKRAAEGLSKPTSLTLESPSASMAETLMGLWLLGPVWATSSRKFLFSELVPCLRDLPVGPRWSLGAQQGCGFLPCKLSPALCPSRQLGHKPLLCLLDRQAHLAVSPCGWFCEPVLSLRLVTTFLAPVQGLLVRWGRSWLCSSLVLTAQFFP